MTISSSFTFFVLRRWDTLCCAPLRPAEQPVGRGAMLDAEDKPLKNANSKICRNPSLIASMVGTCSVVRTRLTPWLLLSAKVKKLFLCKSGYLGNIHGPILSIYIDRNVIRAFFFLKKRFHFPRKNISSALPHNIACIKPSILTYKNTSQQYKPWLYKVYAKISTYVNSLPLLGLTLLSQYLQRTVRKEKIISHLLYFIILASWLWFIYLDSTSCIDWRIIIE